MNSINVTRWVLIFTGLVLLLVASTVFVTAQTGGGYDLSWWTVDGGGGMSTNSSAGYTLHGTAGQPDAETLSGNDYALAGGFWGPKRFEVYVPVVIKD